jgi:hypothetical protein
MTGNSLNAGEFNVLLLNVHSSRCTGCRSMSRIEQMIMKAKEKISSFVMFSSVQYIIPLTSTANRMNADIVAKFFCMAQVPAVR